MGLLSLLATTDYNYSYPSTNVDQTAVAAFMVTLVLFCVIASLISYVLVAFFLSRIFKKAGVASWKAWVPVYNTWVTLELGGQAGWWTILLFVPVANIVALVFLYIAMYYIGLKLGKSGAFVLLAIFLPIVWYIWLAFDQSRWNIPGVPLTTETVPSSPAEVPFVPPTASV